MTDFEYEYRVVARDRGDDKPDYDGPYPTFGKALQAISLLVRDANPPYGEIWIERRLVGGWERMEENE